MAPGVLVQIKRDWRPSYRAPGTPVVGVVQAISPTGEVARIRLDQIGDSYVLVSHLEPVEVAVGAGRSLIGAAAG